MTESGVISNESGDNVACAAPAAVEAEAPLRARVSVVVLTLNEEANIADCLESCAWSDDVHVVDSGSTDRTCEIARELGATIHSHPFESFGRQRNWAITEIAYKHDWVFHLDADERFTPELVQEIAEVLRPEILHAGFYVPHKLMFMGRWLKYAGQYPIYQMRLFHRKRMRFCDYGHGQREETTGLVGRLSRPYLHFNFSKGIEDWIEKHNRYSTLEAQLIFQGWNPGGLKSAWRFSLGDPVQRRRFLKAKIYPLLPGKWFERFVWMYLFKFGFFDGKAGLQYCLLVSSYELFTTLKLDELKYCAQAKSHQAVLDRKYADGTSGGRSSADILRFPQKMPDQLTGSRFWSRIQPVFTSIRSNHQREVHPPPAATPWTLVENVRRVFWMAVRRFLFRPSFHNWYAWRRFLLRLFGAKLARNVRIRPTVNIEMPWNLEIGDDAIVGDHAILYSLGRITIGRRAVISQYAHLCAGTHDYRSRQFPLLRPPIKIGDEAWIAADAFIGPGASVGDRSVIGARASVFGTIPPDVIATGNPAKPVKPRVFDSAPSSDPSAC